MTADCVQGSTETRQVSPKGDPIATAELMSKVVCVGSRKMDDKCRLGMTSGVLRRLRAMAFVRVRVQDRSYAEMVVVGGRKAEQRRAADEQ